jgi:glycosyltransferase involved in cell wall biosynthesis
MKKILILSLAYYPRPVGGAEVAIREITDRTCDDTEYHLITARFDTSLPRTERIGAVTVHRVGFGVPHATAEVTHRPLFYLAKILFVPLAAGAIVRLHRMHHFTGLWAMMSYMTYPIVLARFLGVRLPYVLTIQEGDPFEYVFKRWYIRLFAPLLSRGYQDATVIQTISTFLKEWAQARGARCPIEVIPNGVSVERFIQPPAPQAREEVRAQLNLSRGQTCLITTSRLVHKNAVDDVIRALTHLPESTAFVVLGTGPEEGALRALADELGVSTRVRFLGHVDLGDIPRYLHASDIFVRASRSEGMGNSFIEAMAAGIPVIATQEGGIADFLFDARLNPNTLATGWAVRKNAPEDIARAVEDIRLHPDVVYTVTERAKGMVMERYDWSLVAREMRERVFARLA